MARLTGRWTAWLALAGGLLFAVAGAAQDRGEELESLREAIEKSRERVIGHEANERALLERFEEVDRRLNEVRRSRDRARRDVAAARKTLDALQPALEQASKELAKTQRALGVRAVALYRGGEIGPLRVLFSSGSLREMVARAQALRVLVRHDADLVGRFKDERERLGMLEEEAGRAVAERKQASARLDRVALELAAESELKGELLAVAREDRTGERRLLLELEQAAQALEETIRSLGSKSRRGDDAVSGGNFAKRRGQFPPPVSAPIEQRFGRVVDPEFQTSTFRSGVDFAAPAGASVRAIARGRVRFAGWFRGYGRIVIVDHGDGFHTISGHLDEIHVQVDDPIAANQLIGTVGETGSLGGPSLYFELRRDGKAVDPEVWLLDPRA